MKRIGTLRRPALTVSALMRPETVTCPTVRRPLAAAGRIMAGCSRMLVAGCLGLVVSLAIGEPPAATAQSDPPAIPENARARDYGDGWKCDPGFMRDGLACRAIVLPDNAFLDKRAYRRGWTCHYGFTMTNDDSCVLIDIPESHHRKKSVA